MTLTISDVSEFRRAVKEKFRVEIHFHDGCGGQYFSLDVHSSALQKFIEQYFAQKKCQAVFADDLLSFTVKERVSC